MTLKEHKAAWEKRRYHEAAVVNINDPRANMYGVLPCPRCSSFGRWPSQDKVIHCDDCGFEQKVAS